MKIRYPFLYLVLASGVVAALFLALSPSRKGGGISTSVMSRDRVAVVDIAGVITSSGGSSKGTTSASSVVDQLEEYGDDESIKALVLRIDSPGGTVVAAQEIFSAVTRLREEKGKVVVASMADLGASGGYYVACASDRIFANPGTITGSIGVIMEFPNLEGLLQKVGVRTTTIKSGEFKDTGSAFREMTEKERNLLQALIDDVYGQFVEAVSESRGMSREDVLSVADGRILTGLQARESGLVDELGDFRSALRAAGDLAGIEGEPTVVRKKKKIRFWERLESSFQGLFPLSSRGGAFPSLRVFYLLG